MDIITICKDKLPNYEEKVRELYIIWKGELLKLFTINKCRRRQWHPIPALLPGNSMDGGTWWATVHGVAKSRIWLSDFTSFLSIVPFGEGNGNPFQCSCLENPMDGGPDGLQSMGLQRVGHDLATNTHTHINKCKPFLLFKCLSFWFIWEACWP